MKKLIFISTFLIGTLTSFGQVKPKKKDIDKDALHIKTDFGATNIERILSNMETITLSGSSSKSSSDFVTLEDFAEDLNSVSF